MIVEVNVIHVPVVNFAMQQNHVPVIREITLKNTGKDDLREVCVNISFEPDFASPYQLRIESIPSGAVERISAVSVQLSITFLSQLTERILGHIHMKVSAEAQLLFSKSYEITLLAFDCGAEYRFSPRCWQLSTIYCWPSRLLYYIKLLAIGAWNKK